MNVAASEAPPLILGAVAANLGYAALAGAHALIKTFSDNTGVNAQYQKPESRLDITHNHTVTCSVQKKKENIVSEQTKFVEMVLGIESNVSTLDLERLIQSVKNISNSSLVDYSQNYGGFNVSRALVVYEGKLRVNTDIFTLAIISCSLAILFGRKNKDTELQKMNELYAKSQAAIYQSIRYLKVLQAEETDNEDNIKMQQMLINTLQTTLEVNNNADSPMSTMQETQKIHNERNKEMQILLENHVKTRKKLEYQNAQKKNQIFNLIVLDYTTRKPNLNVFNNGNRIFPEI
jgi:hypothetical protein